MVIIFARSTYLVYLLPFVLGCSLADLRVQVISVVRYVARKSDIKERERSGK